MIRNMLSALVLVCASALSHAGVEVGQQAPDFSLPGSDGQTHTLSEMRGKYVVVAFFPKAYTKG